MVAVPLPRAMASRAAPHAGRPGGASPARQGAPAPLVVRPRAPLWQVTTAGAARPEGNLPLVIFQNPG